MNFRMLFVLLTILSSVLLSPSMAKSPQKIDNAQYHLGKTAPTPFTLKGFSDPEVSHIWTDGKKASIIFPLEIDGRRVQSLRFVDTTANISNSHPQTVSVFLNGTRLIGTYKYSADKPVHTITVKIPSSMRGKAQISFQMPNAIQASKLAAGSKDVRVLGLALSEVEVSFKAK